MGFLRLVSLGFAFMSAAPAFAQLQNLDEQCARRRSRREKIADNFYVLFGVGGNIVVSIGDDRHVDRRRAVPRDGAEIQGEDRRARRRQDRLRDQHARALRSRRRQQGARARRHVDRRARERAADDDEEHRRESRDARQRDQPAYPEGRAAGARPTTLDAALFQRRARRPHALRPRAHDGRHGRAVPQPQPRAHGRRLQQRGLSVHRRRQRRQPERRDRVLLERAQGARRDGRSSCRATARSRSIRTSPISSRC